MKSTSPWLSNGKGTAILQSLLQEQSDYRWNVNEITHMSNQLTSLRLFLQAEVELKHSNCTMWLQLISLTEKLSYLKSDSAIYICVMWQYSNLLLKSCQYLTCGLSHSKKVNLSSLKMCKMRKKEKKSDCSSWSFIIKIVLRKSCENKRITNEPRHTLVRSVTRQPSGWSLSNKKIYENNK